jgi:small subunit ribosomal protein S20
MPNVKSAAKQARSSQRKRLRNQSVQNKIKTGLNRFGELLKSDPKAAKTQGELVISLLDRAAKTGVFHVNRSRRYKSRLVGQINSLAKK